MTQDPAAGAYVAAQLGQQAGETRAAQPGQDVAPPPAGLGVTGVDIDALAATIAAMQERISELEAEKAADTMTPLSGTVATIRHFLTGVNNPAAQRLGDDLAAAVADAQQTGDKSHVEKVAAQLDAALGYPDAIAENYHWTNARAFVSDLPPLIAAFTAPARPDGPAPPAKVVAGSVIG